MTLNHSKTWPVSTLAVVQLRVDPHGRTYSTLTGNAMDPQNGVEDSRQVNDNNDVVQPEGDDDAENGVVYPLSRNHLELFTKMSGRTIRTTIRTDTVSTILEQEMECDLLDDQGKCVSRPEDVTDVEKFHVLALTRIEEHINEGDIHAMGRRPSIKVDNWDFIYTETKPNRCPIHRCINESNSNGGGVKDPPDLPLDARKTTTLRRHYYLEGGWGWVVVVCSVLVHVLNHGVQLSCSQLILPGAEKFKVETVHFADFKPFITMNQRNEHIQITVVGDGFTGKTSMLLWYKNKKFENNYVPTIFDSYSFDIVIAGENYSVTLCDSAGQENYEMFRQAAYKKTNVFILCYSVDNLVSWENAKNKWAPELKKCRPEAKIILAATKCDNEKPLQVKTEKGRQLSQLIKADGFIENSSKLGYNIDDTFSLAYTAFINSIPKGGTCVTCSVL